MDYGAHLKQTVGNLTQRSKSYSRQSAFRGSVREMRGVVIKLLSVQPYSWEKLVSAMSGYTAHPLESILSDLEQEGLIKQGKVRISLKP